MSTYHLALLIAAVVAGWFARKQPRAWLWIGALALSFIVSVAYLYMPKHYYPGMWWPPASLVAAMCDIAVVIAIRELGREKWETRLLFGLMMISVSVNLLYATGTILGFPPIPPHEVYAIILEAINYAALLLIAGTGLLERMGASNGHHTTRGLMARFLAFGRFLHEKDRQCALSKW